MQDTLTLFYYDDDDDDNYSGNIMYRRQEELSTAGESRVYMCCVVASEAERNMLHVARHTVDRLSGDACGQEAN